MFDDKQYLLERLELAETSVMRGSEVTGQNPQPYLRIWDKIWNELDRRYEK